MIYVNIPRIASFLSIISTALTERGPKRRLQALTDCSSLHPLHTSDHTLLSASSTFLRRSFIVVAHHGRAH